ncbi:pseudouridine synthase, partial [Phormidium willei BDU 130791]
MTITLDVTESGDRLDRILSQNLVDLSRSRIQQLIEQNCVRVNGEPCLSKKLKVQAGDRLSIEIPPATPLEIQPLDMALDILYEDDHLLIVNKPAGLVVHPAPGHYNDTLVNALLAHCGDRLSGIGGVQRPGIVHRLDKDTTGAIVIAKSDRAHQHLQAQIQAKTARREYLGIVYGSPSQPSGIINRPIARHQVDRKKMAIVPEDQGGRTAVTHWQVQEALGNYSLVHFRLETGRTHQIRVHSASIGHPIVGDPLYGSGRSLGVNLPGQALHAWKLTLEHPQSGDTI